MKIEILKDENAIQERIQQLGKKISSDYEGKELVVLGVLNGAFLFCADLVRKIELPFIVDFISLSSYGDEKVSSGKVILDLDLKHDIKGKDVLIVEDIIDTGETLDYLVEHLKERSPKSIRTAALLSKTARRKKDVQVDYTGFDIDDLFVVGYGLDIAGMYRGLPYIGHIPN